MINADAVVPVPDRDRDDVEDHDIGPVPRPQVPYPCHVCHKTLLGTQVSQCPGTCTFCIHSNCLRDVNIRNEEYLCPLCRRHLSPTTWYTFYIRYEHYNGEAGNLPEEAR